MDNKSEDFHTDFIISWKTESPNFENLERTRTKFANEIPKFVPRKVRPRTRFLTEYLLNCDKKTPVEVAPKI